MLIVCNENEFEKKKLKKIKKVIISEHLAEYPEDENHIVLSKLVPSMKLFAKFIDGDISKKKYEKEYINSIKEDEEAYATLLAVLAVYKKYKIMAFVCSSQEWNFYYMQFILKFIQEKFLIKCIMPYSQWKESQPKDFIIDVSKLNKELKKYKELIYADDSDFESKDLKKKKKKSKDKKKKDKKSKIKEPKRITVRFK